MINNNGMIHKLNSINDNLIQYKDMMNSLNEYNSNIESLLNTDLSNDHEELRRIIKENLNQTKGYELLETLNSNGIKEE